MTRNLIDVLTDQGFVGSKSEARRLVAQRQVKVDGALTTDSLLSLADGAHEIQVGKNIARVVEVKDAT